MYSTQTIKEYSRVPIIAKKKIGARIDYRIKKNLNEFQTDDFIEELNMFCGSMNLKLSGFGYKNYSGIILGTDSERIFKEKVSSLKIWLAQKTHHVNMAHVGKVQPVSKIFFE